MNQDRQATTRPGPERWSAPLTSRLFSLGENMIEILVEGEGEIPEALFARYLAETDRRSGPKEQWTSGTLSAQVSEVLTRHGETDAVRAGRELQLEDEGFQVYFRVAGDAYDVAVCAAALGTPAYLASAVGDCPASDFMWRWMEREGVHLDHCLRLPGQQVGSHFLVRGRKRYSRWGSAAARLAPGALRINYGLTDIFHTFGGTTQMLSATMRAVVTEQVARARAAGSLLSYTLNDRPDLRESTAELAGAFDQIAPWVQLLFVGVDEAATVFALDASPATSEEASVDAARTVSRALLPRCPELRCLFVTDGPYGVHVFEGTQKPKHLLPTLVAPQAIVEPIGAGDAFVGGVLHGILQGFPYHRAAEIGMITSQLNTLGHGAAVVPDRETVLRHLGLEYAWPPQMLRRL